MDKELWRKYPYIWAWGRMTGSYEYFIISQCRKAEADKAPQDAIYFRGGGTKSDPRVWVTARELKPEMQAQLKADIEAVGQS